MAKSVGEGEKALGIEALLELFARSLSEVEVTVCKSNCWKPDRL